MQEVAAVRLPHAGAGDQGNGLAFVRAELDFAVGRRAGNDPRAGEESLGGKIVAAARPVLEYQGDRTAGPKLKRLRRSVVASRTFSPGSSVVE